MEEKTLKILEFDKILALIADRAFTKSAKNNILNLTPGTDIRKIELSHKTIGECIKLIVLTGTLPLYGYEEITEYAVHAQKSGMLRQGALLRIAASLKTAKQVKRFVEDTDEAEKNVPLLFEYVYELNGLTPLERDLNAAIISDTELADTASPTLYDIRRQIRTTNASVKDKLNSIINSQQNKKYLQDSIITLRNNRYVVPVKSESRNEISGIVHDTSSSGLTLFVEPTAIVNLNNRLRELEIEEQAEIEVILRAFSQRVQKEAVTILNNEKVMLLLDEFFAKAAYAYDGFHTAPAILSEQKISLNKARHPLLNQKTAVASDITIGGDFIQMVITGPNTGGKTVTLKTLGLCVLMAQSGLYIPAQENSAVCILTDVFADIGDEQSIAQSLSTFSAHMTNIIGILNKLNSSSLVLLDELGAGTDPAEGAALAWAILSEIMKSGALCAATTHYNEIKQYALTTPKAVNASVEFDVNKLCPTYRLTIGLPGKSNAFEIAQRLGLSQDVISSARSVMSGANASFEDIIRQLNEKLNEANKSNLRAQSLLNENRLLHEEAAKMKAEAQQIKEKALASAAVEGKKILKEAKDAAKEIMAGADKYSQNNPADRNEIKKQLEQTGKSATDKLNSAIPQHDIRKDNKQSANTPKFKKDDEVYIPSLNLDAIVLYVEKDTAMVQAGIIKTNVALSLLQPKRKKKEKSFAYTGMKSLSASSRLDIRGITATEVIIELEKFLDDALLAGLKTVTIVHGKGEGILKKAVEQALRENPNVESFRTGGLNEGGSGATIAYLE